MCRIFCAGRDQQQLEETQTSLLYPCFKTVFCYGVVSGCFVPRVSFSRFGPQLAPKRGPAAQSWLLERPKVRAKSMQKLLGHNAAFCSSDFERSAGMALNHTRT